MRSSFFNVLNEGFGEGRGILVYSFLLVLQSENRHPVVPYVPINKEFTILIATIFYVLHGSIDVVANALGGRFTLDLLVAGVMGRCFEGW